MVGTGVFVSLHFQVLSFQSAPPIFALWIAGGLAALCGALSYAALAKALPRSGGEYHFLGQLYHPSLGFMAGLLSALIGFAAPTAIVALALGAYAQSCFPDINPKIVAAVVILLGAISHAMSARTSGRVQLVSTVLKMLFIVAFLVAAVILPGHGDIRWTPQSSDWSAMMSPAFGISLMFVFYAYSGWNAAVYGLEEWKQPESTVKRALVGGTIVVMILYVALNAAFLHAAPLAALQDKMQVADAAAQSLFGAPAARWTSGLLAVGLFSSVSALLWAGPRVLGTMGRNMPALGWFAPTDGVPRNALVFQTVLALAFVMWSSLGTLIDYTQAGLILCSALAVMGIFVLRRRGLAKELNPVIPLVFIAMSVFVIGQSLYKEITASDKTLHGLAAFPTVCGLLTALVCALLWFPFNRKSR